MYRAAALLAVARLCLDDGPSATWVCNNAIIGQTYRVCDPGGMILWTGATEPGHSADGHDDLLLTSRGGPSVPGPGVHLRRVQLGWSFGGEWAVLDGHAGHAPARVEDGSR